MYDRRIRPVMAIVRMQLSRTLGSSRTLVLAMVVPMYLYYYLRPIMNFSGATQHGITPFAAVFVFSDYTGGLYMSVFVLLGAVLLYADLPYIDYTYEQSTLRAGRINWLYGSVGHILMLSILYVLYWVFCSIAVTLPYIDWRCEWGTIWKTLAMTDAVSQYGVGFLPSVVLIRLYDPLVALGFSTLLKINVCMVLGLVIFFGNLLFRNVFGTLCACALTLQDIFSFWQGFAYVWISPASMSRLDALDHTGGFLQPSLPQALVTFLGLIVALVVVIRVGGRRLLQKKSMGGTA
ncbi:MAG: hypothetical protein RR337_08025 [Clostridia bacterium]